MIRLHLILIVICISQSMSLPSSFYNHSDDRTERMTRAVRHREEPQEKVTWFGQEITLPRWVSSIKKSASGVVTKVENFFDGNNTLTTHVFGRSIDIRAPTSKAAAFENMKNFFLSFSTDSYTRLLFVAYINVVAFVIVYAFLLVNHIQLSLNKQKKLLQSKAAASTHIRTKSPDANMPLIQGSRDNSPSDNSPLSEHGIEEARSPNWSAMVNRSLIHTMSQDTIQTTGQKPRLLTDLEELLSPSRSNNYASASPEISLDVTQLSSPTSSKSSPVVQTTKAVIEHYRPPM